MRRAATAITPAAFSRQRLSLSPSLVAVTVVGCGRRGFATLPSKAKVLRYHAHGQPDKVLKYVGPDFPGWSGAVNRR